MQNIKRQFAKAKEFYNSNALTGLTNIGILKICKTFPSLSQRFAGNKYTESMTEEEQARIAKAIEEEKGTYRRRGVQVITNKDVDDNFKYTAIKELRDELMPLSPEIIELIRFDPEALKQEKKEPQEKPVDKQTIAYNEMKANEKPRTMYASSLVLPYERSKVYQNLRLEDDRHHRSKNATYPAKQKVQFIRSPSPAPEKYTYNLKKFEGLSDTNSRDRYV